MAVAHKTLFYEKKNVYKHEIVINFNIMTFLHNFSSHSHSQVLLALFATVVRCQETIVDEDSNGAAVAAAAEERSKEKRGISLNLGSGLEGYSYLGPSSRGLNRGYAGGYQPMTEYGKLTYAWNERARVQRIEENGSRNN